ncbi:hypothetical protein C8F04DRAFT_1365250 [Mycena alexandri]|uniref:Uncharacterized protein n=1 Tax=Mycena alexandri TaxID=1745969 RepID=A0AAD6WKR3_9AGAR|nr:hypothetical protein C8F04DRAFT_1365250 [Mycena alexandri]
MANDTLFADGYAPPLCVTTAATSLTLVILADACAPLALPKLPVDPITAPLILLPSLAGANTSPPRRTTTDPAPLNTQRSSDAALRPAAQGTPREAQPAHGHQEGERERRALSVPSDSEHLERARCARGATGSARVRPQAALQERDLPPLAPQLPRPPLAPWAPRTAGKTDEISLACVSSRILSRSHCPKSTLLGIVATSTSGWMGTATGALCVSASTSLCSPPSNTHIMSSGTAALSVRTSASSTKMLSSSGVSDEVGSAVKVRRRVLNGKALTNPHHNTPIPLSCFTAATKRAACARKHNVGEGGVDWLVGECTYNEEDGGTPMGVKMHF